MNLYPIITICCSTRYIPDIIDYYNNNDEDVMNAYASSKDISIYKKRKNNDMINIKISCDLELNTPLLRKIIGDKFKIETDRTIYEK